MDYADNKFLSSEVKRVQNQIAMVGAAGEPMKTGHIYTERERTLAEHGFLLYEHLTTADMENSFSQIERIIYTLLSISTMLWLLIKL